MGRLYANTLFSMRDLTLTQTEKLLCIILRDSQVVLLVGKST